MPEKVVIALFILAMLGAFMAGTFFERFNVKSRAIINDCYPSSTTLSCGGE